MLTLNQLIGCYLLVAGRNRWKADGRKQPTTRLGFAAKTQDNYVETTINTTVLGFVTHPVPTPGLTAPQLDLYFLCRLHLLCSAAILLAAWAYSTGYTSTIAVIDDGFDPTRTALFGFFNKSLSRNFGAGLATNLAEPIGDFHGTTTSGLIGNSGAGGQPVGLAPNATIIGVKVDVGTVPLSEYVNALALCVRARQRHQ